MDTAVRPRPPYPTAARLGVIEPFHAMALFRRAVALEAAGAPVIHMSLGEPDFGAPPPVTAALDAAVKAGLTGYTPACGITPLREAMWACGEKIAERLDGEIVVRLFKGTATAVKRKSPNSLYAEKMVSFEGEEIYSHKDAGGFIKLLSLPERIRAIKAHGGAK